MERKLISSGSPMEGPIGFSRAVRVGSVVSVSGTAPMTPNGSTAAPGDVYGQTKCCLEIMARAIESAGAALEDVIRTRVMLTDIRSWEEAARAHSEYFAEIRPASTFLQVSGFVRDDWLVEMEADCVLDA